MKSVTVPEPEMRFRIKRVLSIGFKLLLLILLISALYQDLIYRGMIRTGALYYFTFQSNILVGLCLVLTIFLAQSNRFRSLFRGLCLLAITMTGIIYNFVLYKIWLDWNTIGYAYSSTVLHVVMPIGFILDWLLFDKHVQMKWIDLSLWLSYPFIYAICSVYMSFRTGTSLYFFFDTRRGYNTMLKWLAALIFSLLLIGILYIIIDHLLGRKNNAAPSHNNLL